MSTTYVDTNLVLNKTLVSKITKIAKAQKISVSRWLEEAGFQRLARVRPTTKAKIKTKA